MNGRQSVEDYLEAILRLQEERGSCRSIDVANHMGFSKPSVSVAVGKLTRSGYLIKREDGELILTEEGLALARDTLEKHCLLTRFFIEIGVSPEQAEKDACAIEHSLSQESYQRLLAWQAKPKEEQA